VSTTSGVWLLHFDYLSPKQFLCLVGQVRFLDEATDPSQPVAAHSAGAAAPAGGDGALGAGTSSGGVRGIEGGMQQQGQQQQQEDEDSCFCPWELWPPGVSTDQVLTEQPKLEMSLVS
jgi:hypothetical protein